MSKEAEVRQKALKPKMTFSDFWTKYSTLIIMVIMLIVFGALEPKAFVSTNNLIKIIEQSSITILLACGEFFGILLAGIDLSVGSVMALSGVVSAKLLGAGWGVVPTLLVGVIGFGALVGAINGGLINITGLHPFIITLGTQAIFRGLTVILAQSRPVPAVAFARTFGGKLFGVIPTPIFIALLTAAFLVFFTTKSKAGRNLYAIGGNKKAAWFAGIHVKKHFILAFVISGICASLAGMVNISRLASAEPNAGTGYETFAIASAIIGGTSFFGGIGKIPRVVLGAIIIGIINNGINMVGLSAYYQQIAMGALIIIAVTLDRFFGTSKKSEV
ncbi:MAG: D-allose ABC transporter permease [Christensenellaceae bacterium]|nr:D-allose ABC transporter permease [Christensenellaceae bacterium]